MKTVLVEVAPVFPDIYFVWVFRNEGGWEMLNLGYFHAEEIGQLLGGN